MKKVLLGLLYVISGLAGSVIMLVNGLLIAYMIEEITKEPFDMKKGIALGIMILVEILASMMVCTPVETAVNKSRIRKSERLKKELTKAIAGFNALVQECRRDLTQQKEYVENLNYEVSDPDLEHYAKTLTEEQLADFGVHAYLAVDYINQERCKTAEIQTECEVIIGKVKECSKDFVMVTQYSGKLDSICRKLKKQNKEFQEKLMDIREKKGQIENMLEKKLTCTLQVEEVSGLPYVTGFMSCHDHRGRLKREDTNWMK